MKTPKVVWTACAGLAAVLIGTGLETSRAWQADLLQSGSGIAVGILLLVLVPFAIYGLMRLFARWFPIASGYELTYTQSDWASFRRQTWASTALWGAIAAALGGLLYGAFYLGNQAAALLVGSRYALPRDPAAWVFPAACGGLALAAPLVYWIYQRRLKERFPRFVAFHNQRLGFDQRQAGSSLALFGLLLGLGLFLGGLGNSLRAGPDGVTISGPLGLVQEKYPYSELVFIEERARLDPRQPQRILARAYVLQFKDGRQWQSVSVGLFPVPPVYQAALAYIAERSGISFERTVVEP